MKHDSSDSHDDHPQNLPFWRVSLSVLQACFGVQNRANRERDFSQQSIWPYVVAALVLTALFVTGLLWVVGLVVSG